MADEEAYEVCGGNIFYLQKYVAEAQEDLRAFLPTQKKRMASGDFSYVGQESFRLNEFFRDSSKKYPWTKEELIVLMQKLEATNREAECFLVYDDLCSQMGSTVVDAFIRYNILHLRTSRRFAYDLKDVPAAQAIVTPENSSILFAMRELLKK